MFKAIGLLVSFLLVAATVACSGDSPPPAGTASPTPTPRPQSTPPPETATPPPTTAPAPDVSFLDFVKMIDAALDAGDRQFFLDRALTGHIVCTAADVNPQGAGGPSCEFVGQEYEGFTIGFWRSEGGIVPVENAIDVLAYVWTAADTGSSDAYGSGAPRVYATGKNTLTGRDQFVAVTTAMVERPEGYGTGGPIRISVLTLWEPHGAEWQLAGILSAYVLGEEFLDPSPETEGWVNDWAPYP